MHLDVHILARSQSGEAETRLAPSCVCLCLVGSSLKNWVVISYLTNSFRLVWIGSGGETWPTCRGFLWLFLKGFFLSTGTEVSLLLFAINGRKFTLNQLFMRQTNFGMQNSHLLRFLMYVLSCLIPIFYKCWILDRFRIENWDRENLDVYKVNVTVNEAVTALYIPLFKSAHMSASLCHIMSQYRQRTQIVTAFSLTLNLVTHISSSFPFLVLCILLAGVWDLHKVSHSALSITHQSQHSVQLMRLLPKNKIIALWDTDVLSFSACLSHLGCWLCWIINIPLG